MGLFNRKDKTELHKKNLTEKHMEIKIDRSHQNIKPNLSGYVTLWVQDDGMIYFGDNHESLYEPLELVFHPSRFHEKRQAPTSEKTKRTGRATGAAVGGLLFGPVGAAVGAAYGTGNTTTSGGAPSTITRQIPAWATLTLKRDTGTWVSQLRIEEDEDRIRKLSTLLGIPVGTEAGEGEDGKSSNNEHADPYEELKKLSELKDMGVITQDEFDAKKRQLLGL